ncbi:hypothetical protein HanXRQr2_Chr15g0712911 [Helianthus annuus]|uniref:Uncharacterized protein n=1 Tax=Helianthus annuus TaxID=4232 RepID=A0A9K3E363_HELAN|nr:hypothetical protein HanXRQr2_Chr15g0712911 [Helianthus annuus]
MLIFCPSFTLFCYCIGFSRFHLVTPASNTPQQIGHTNAFFHRYCKRQCNKSISSIMERNKDDILIN